MALSFILLADVPKKGKGTLQGSIAFYERAFFIALRFILLQMLSKVVLLPLREKVPDRADEG